MAAATLAPSSFSTEAVNSYAELRRLFPNPPASFSTAPFFVWNGEMTESEIDKHLADYHAQGIRAFFIHPRPGMITPYLSDRWFALCRYTVDKAKQLGMQAWLYDENSYPSGFAGGHVPAEMPESWNEGQGLVLHKLPQFPADPGKYKIILKKAAGSFEDVTASASPEQGRQGDYLAFDLSFYEKSPWYGGFTYVDLIRPGVTEKFIEVTMRGYERTLGPDLGKTVPGVFTDEPNIVPPADENCIRWTPDLFDQFKKRWGYDLRPHLPSLFEQTGEWQRVRHNYYALLLDLFIGRWAKPWNRYADSKGIAWTGHYWEHEWPNPRQGPDNMAMYAWSHVPGIDMLFNQFAENVAAQFGNIRSVKELASVANQVGARRALSETYGGAGWELRFEDMKRLGDWEYALGVNLMNQHLSFQTIVGARKYDYPQSFTYHEPWWSHYGVLANYFARLSLALSAGEQVNRVLVIEPTSSAWMYASAGQADPRLMQLGETFQAFVTRFEKLQGEYDLGCENIIRDRGKADGARFVVGRRAYDLVVLPPGTESLDAATVKLLGEFLRGGGKVFSFVEPPARVDGAEDARVTQLASQFDSSWTRADSLDDPQARKMLLPAGITDVAGQLLHQRRVLDGGELLFFANHSLEQPARATIKIAGKSLMRLNPFDGSTTAHAARSEGNALVFSV
ncbi:MAG TPA: glycosyl hydrolase, partial [Patescibacteria group bacterium]|nr:glycosyl hydrolase [Patescibacteria group bacterium]